MRKMKKRCTHCRKWFAMELQTKTLVRKEQIRIYERLTRPNPKGTLETAIERFAPGERLYYDLVYVCKYCGAEEKELVWKDVKK